MPEDRRRGRPQGSSSADGHAAVALSRHAEVIEQAAAGQHLAERQRRDGEIDDGAGGGGTERADQDARDEAALRVGALLLEVAADRLLEVGAQRRPVDLAFDGGRRRLPSRRPAAARRRPVARRDRRASAGGERSAACAWRSRRGAVQGWLVALGAAIAPDMVRPVSFHSRPLSSSMPV